MAEPLLLERIRAGGVLASQVIVVSPSPPEIAGVTALPLDYAATGGMGRIPWSGVSDVGVFSEPEDGARRDSDARCVMGALQVPESVSRIVVEVQDESLTDVLGRRLGDRVEVFPKEAADARIVVHVPTRGAEAMALLTRLAGMDQSTTAR